MSRNVFRLTAMKYAESTLPEKMVFPDGRQEVQLPISFLFYLIEIPGHRVLVDVGCDEMPGFDMRFFCKPVEVLERYGLKPEDITDVIITHAHHDHIAALHYFCHAKVHIQQAEYEAGRGKYIPDGLQVHCFSEETVVGGLLRVKKIGGHSTGSCVVEFRQGDQTGVICGDECYSMTNLTQQIPTGSSRCPEKSAAFVQKYSGTQYVPYLLHTPEVLPGANGWMLLMEQKLD